jgi:threonine/homoserine/homoserine lactone efflux protein
MNLDRSLIAFVVLGIAYAALPGVVNTEAFRRGMRGGFKPALLVQVGALIGDAAWAIIALAGASVLLRYDAFGLALGIMGAGFLFYLARKALVGAWRGDSEESAPARDGQSLTTGVVFSLANPAGLAFWTGMGGGILGMSSESPSLQSAAVFLAAFIVGALAWGSAMAALVGWGRRFATPRVFRVIEGLCGVALAYFGARLLWSTLQRYGRWMMVFARAMG